MAGVKNGRVDAEYSDKFTGKDPLKQVSWEIAQKRLNDKNSQKSGVETGTPSSTPPARQIYQGGKGSPGLDPETGDWRK